MSVSNDKTVSGAFQRWVEVSRVNESRDTQIENYALTKEEFLGKYSECLSTEDVEHVQALPEGTRFWPKSIELPRTVTEVKEETFDVTFSYTGNDPTKW